MKKSLLLKLLVCICYGQSNAQDISANSDRPRHTISTYTIPKKWLQSELQFSGSRNKITGGNDLFYEHPSLLLRYGLTDRIEMRTSSAYLTEKNFYGINSYSTRTGLRSIQVGGKVRILNNRGAIPAISLTVNYRINNPDFLKLKYDTVNGGNFRISFQNRLSDNLSIDYNAGIDWLNFKQGSERYTYSLSPSFLISEKWKVYLETYGFIWPDVEPVHFIKTGGSYQINSRMTIDLVAGRSWNTNSAKKAEVYANGDIAISFSHRFKTNNNTSKH